MINLNHAKQLVQAQFPKWKNLPIEPVPAGGSDNRTFRLGDHLLLRFPSAHRYIPQIEKEQKWLPILAPSLPLTIPKPIAQGAPDEIYPWPWSIYEWIEGEPPTFATNLDRLAADLADFLLALQKISPEGGPLPGKHNFFRGGALSTYASETRQAIETLRDQIDANAVTALWEEALSSSWEGEPVWVHGDICAGNLLVNDGILSAVIDFGMLGIGDPACDLSICWTFFTPSARKTFRDKLPFDPATWTRARGWTLWKALITKNLPIVEEVLPRS